MPNVRTQCREAYTPRAISKGILKALVEALVDFKPGLPTTSRKIKARAISAGKSTELEGPECWKVTDPHSLAELENVRVELLLASTDHRKCELHVEFRSGQILLSVSDIETSWGKSVFEGTRVLLSELGISSSGFNERLRKAYGLLDIFQNVLLALATSRDKLLSQAHVIATGAGYKITRGVKTGALSIVCSVTRKVALNQLRSRDQVPPAIDGIPTDVVATGVIRALQARTARFRPAPGGVSIGHRAITAGTLGCLVRRHGQVFRLSNNQVIANSNDEQRGDALLH